ncbi:MAG: DUF167 domain-containing protein [Candidatus Komeilibacteria bacterium]
MDKIYQVKVITRARQNSVEVTGDQIKVKLNVPPVDGKANLAMLRLLASYFKIKKSQIEIVGGEKTHHKVVKIYG